MKPFLLAFPGPRHTHPVSSIYLDTIELSTSSNRLEEEWYLFTQIRFEVNFLDMKNYAYIPDGYRSITTSLNKPMYLGPHNKDMSSEAYHEFTQSSLITKLNHYLKMFRKKPLDKYLTLLGYRHDNSFVFIMIPYHRELIKFIKYFNKYSPIPSELFLVTTHTNLQIKRAYPYLKHPFLENIDKMKNFLVKIPMPSAHHYQNLKL